MRSSRSRTPSVVVPRSCTGSSKRRRCGGAIEVPPTRGILAEFRAVGAVPDDAALASVHDPVRHARLTAVLHERRSRNAPAARFVDIRTAPAYGRARPLDGWKSMV